jgi:hypothetical protein
MKRAEIHDPQSVSGGDLKLKRGRWSGEGEGALEVVQARILRGPSEGPQTNLAKLSDVHDLWELEVSKAAGGSAKSFISCG